MEATYFTCTLGQASSHQAGKSYKTVSDFIVHKAQSAPDTPAVGFYEVCDKSSSQWRPQILSFKDIWRGCTITAEALSKQIVAEEGQTVALLCPSSADFLFVWLALIWLGYPALLIAPQCSPSAVQQLCKSCNVRYLLYDETYRDLAKEASAEASRLGDTLQTLLLPFTGQNIFQTVNCPSTNSGLRPAQVQETHIAYLHHTSGTSSGTPKPIPQSHRAAIGVLPILDGRKHASFTTTPLYHGGIADVFRAWTSDALIWLFPAKEIPITAANVCKCLEIAQNSAAGDGTPEVKYFSSVPHVLQMMAENRNGSRHLQQMDIVGVGGAALPVEVGDKLVQNDVNLVSRFGSAECGFLMSSHRDYAKDKHWQHLRSELGGEALSFEPREEGLSELFVLADWPHMAKRNREDGSYATADLFAPHPTIPNAWRYHSRADSQLTLITGKKFDPAPLEDEIKAAASLVLDDVLMFGNGKPYPGALLFRSAAAANISDHNLIDQIAPRVEKMNRKSQSHARVPQNMLVPMPHLERALQKSSKGTILRNASEARFAKEIEAAYDDVPSVSTPHGGKIPDDDVHETVRCIVLQVSESSTHSQDGGILTDDTDLFNYGIDSVASIRIRHALSRLLPPGAVLPSTIVQDAGTITQLVKQVLRTRSGKAESEPHDSKEEETKQHSLMIDLAKQYSKFRDFSRGNSPTATTSSSTPNRRKTDSHGIQVLLTGPTGSLGAHLLSQLLTDPSISAIHLLVRGATSNATRERVLKALQSRNLPLPPDFASKVSIYSCKLADSTLGLSTEQYNSLAASIDVIVHLAWSVNFLQPLRSFAGTHLAGLTNLINFALSSDKRSTPPPRFIFCSSVAAVSKYTATPRVPEHILSDPAVAGPTGYARSKWVAEQICSAAHDETRLRDRISVARVGQLSGATDSGIWSASEAYPLMLSSMNVTGVLPDLDNARRRKQGVSEGEVLGWLPVDIAARAFVEAILTPPSPLCDLSRVKAGGANGQCHGVPGYGAGLAVHHVLNPSNETTWSHLLTWLSKHETIHTVSVEDWISRLDDLLHAKRGQRNEARDDDHADRATHTYKRQNHDHPALRLVDFWRDAYGDKLASQTPMQPKKATLSSSSVGEVKAYEPEPPLGRGQEPDRDASSLNQPGKAQSRFEMTDTYARMPSLRDAEDLVDEAYVLRLWNWIKANV